MKKCLLTLLCLFLLAASCSSTGDVRIPTASELAGSPSGDVGEDGSVLPSDLPAASESGEPTTTGSPSAISTTPTPASGNNPYFIPRDGSQNFSATLGGEAVSVFPHPRIWLNPTSILELKAKATSSNPMWVGLQVSVDAGISSGSYQTAADGGTAMNYALAYLVTGQASYLNAAKKVLFNFMNPALYSIACDGSTYCGNDNLDYGSIELNYIAATFDWIFPALTTTEKQTFMNWVFTQFIPFLRLHPYYGDSLHNLGHTKWCGEYLWSLASLGDDSRAEPLASSSYVFWNQQILPILDDAFPGGHTYSGSGYGYNRVFKYQLYAFEASLTAFGKNMYAGHPWPIDEVYYRVHATLPQEDLFMPDWESAEASFNQGRMNENEVILANRYRGTPAGKLAQYYIQNVFRPRAYSNQGGTRVNPVYISRWFLWYDPSFAQEDFGATQATSYVADGLGVFMSREDWHDATSTWLGLSASKYVGDHQLHNEGSFKIFKREYLVVENGRFYTGQNSNLTPVDTNIVFMGTGAVEYGNVTGGLYRRYQGSLANIDQHLASDAARLSYARADLKTAYHPSYFPMDYFHRNMVHLKSMGGSSFDYVVLFDRIRSTNSVAKRAFFHIVNTPSLNGAVATMSSTNNLSKMFVHNLLPESSSFVIDAVSDKTAGGHAQESSDHLTRLVIQNSAASRDDSFLAVFAITDSVGSSSPSVSRVESSDGKWIGAFVGDSGENRVAVFSRTNVSSTTAFTYTVAKSAATQHSIYDLSPGGHYSVSIVGTSNSRTVTITPDSGGSFVASDEGALIFVD